MLQTTTGAVEIRVFIFKVFICMYSEGPFNYLKSFSRSFTSCSHRDVVFMNGILSPFQRTLTSKLSVNIRYLVALSCTPASRFASSTRGLKFLSGKIDDNEINGYVHIELCFHN